MAADLFETYAVTIVATMVLASIYFAGTPALLKMMTYPLAIGGACIITSIIGTFFVRLGASQSIMGALYKGFIASAVLSLGAIWYVTYELIGFGAIQGVVNMFAITGEYRKYGLISASTKYEVSNWSIIATRLPPSASFLSRSATILADPRFAAQTVARECPGGKQKGNGPAGMFSRFVCGTRSDCNTDG